MNQTIQSGSLVIKVYDSFLRDRIEFRHDDFYYSIQKNRRIEKDDIGIVISSLTQISGTNTFYYCVFPSQVGWAHNHNRSNLHDPDSKSLRIIE